MSADDEEKARLEREIYRTIIHRDSRQTNIIEVIILFKIFQLKNYKAIYKQYSSLYFIMGIDSFENELAGLEVFITFCYFKNKNFLFYKIFNSSE